MTYTEDQLLEQAQRAMCVGFAMGARATREIAETCVRVAETRMEDAILAGIRRGCERLNDDVARDLLGGSEEDDGGLADQIS